MTESDKLQVELQRDDIIVTMPGTSFACELSKLARDAPAHVLRLGWQ